MSAPAAIPTPDPADVESVDAIVAAVYDVISGGAGVARDWDRWSSLFAPEARLVPTGRDEEGNLALRAMSPGEYAERAGPFLEGEGFFETEIAHVTERYGSIAHRFSSYASFRTAEDEEPFDRGINSFQLFHDGARWWVLTIFWQAETEELPIPERYLGGSG